MSEYNIDGITYEDNVPHSRIEKQLMDILSKMTSNNNNNATNDNQNDDPNNNQNGGD